MVLLATLALVGSHAVTATSSTTLQQSDTTVASRRRAVPSRDVPGEGVNGFQTGAASVGSPQERLLSSTNSS